MKKQFKLGVIGCGVIATSIIKGVVLSDFLREKKIIVSDISEDRLDAVEYLGVRTTTDNKFVAENSEFLLFAVKAQNFDDVVKSLGGYLPEKVISVMAGIKKSAIKNALGVGVIKVARCVPNLPCTIGSGAIAIDMCDFNKSTDDTDFISNVFDKLGTVVSLPENKFDVVTGLSGIGPAYAFMFMDSLIQAGVKHGLTKSEAKVLAVQTVFGSAEMVSREEQSLEGLLMQVCKNDSTAIQAVKSLQDGGLDKIVEAAVNSCIAFKKEN